MFILFAEEPSKHSPDDGEYSTNLSKEDWYGVGELLGLCLQGF